MVEGLRLLDQNGQEICRIWLDDGLIHHTGNAKAAEGLMTMYVELGGRVYTPDDGAEWLEVLYQTYRASYFSLKPFSE